MRFVLALAASAALWVQPAQASVVLGVGETSSPEFSVSLSTPFYAGPGEYHIETFFSRPVYIGQYSLHTDVHWHEYLVEEPHTYVGGNNNDDYRDVATSGDYISLYFTLKKDYSEFGGSPFGPIETKYEHNYYGNYLSVLDDDPVGYRVTSTWVSGVPEPSTWAFMILGIGAVGAAMRRKPALKLSPA